MEDSLSFCNNFQGQPPARSGISTPPRLPNFPTLSALLEIPPEGSTPPVCHSVTPLPWLHPRLHRWLSLALLTHTLLLFRLPNKFPRTRSRMELQRLILFSRIFVFSDDLFFHASLCRLTLLHSEMVPVFFFT